MKKLFIIISALSLLGLGCTKSSTPDKDKLVFEKATAKSIFTNMGDLDTGIDSATYGNQQDLTPQQIKIANMLKPCTITTENPNDNTSVTTFTGEACPIYYTKNDHYTNSDTSASKDFIVKTSEFEKLAKFTKMKEEMSSKSESTETSGHIVAHTKNDFRSNDWGIGVHITDIDFKGNSINDKHMDFTVDLSTSVKSEKVDLAIIAKAAGTMITDENDNTTVNLTSTYCTLNGTPVSCEELLGVTDGKTLTKKTIAIRSQL
jgi:hypothetical protein